MTFDFYLELASRALDTGLLDLLRFPLGEAPLASKPEISACWWEHGKTKRMKSRDREKIIEKVCATGINQLEIKWRSAGGDCAAGLTLLEACLDFFPSPMSQLWAEVPIHQLKSHSEEMSRRNFRNKESVLTREHTVPYPSTVECFLRMDARGERLKDDQLQELSVAWIRAVMPSNLAQQPIFGYGCVHGTCRRMGMVQSLGFPEIDQLGAKFENVYPILIGPRASCEGLATALGFGSVMTISDAAPSAILSMNTDGVKAASQNPATKEWLVERPHVSDKLGPRAFVVPPRLKPH